MDWDSIIEGIVILRGNFNVHSPDWNIHCGERTDATGLEGLVDTYNLILNIEPGKATRPTQRKITSIINLTFTTHDIGVLNM